jgi:spore coat polysaccharide biosynthesis protein SpsF (cytidylyltransferase family)
LIIIIGSLAMNANLEIGFIVQARTGSVRFADKVIRKFYREESILEILIKKLKRFEGIPIIIATTTKPGDDIIVKIAANQGVSYFRGSEDNVLERFIKAAGRFNIDHVIRVCSDNAFIDVDGLEEIIVKYRSKPVDYLSFILSDNRPSIKTHFGFWAEIASLKALKKIAAATNEKKYLEHVTSYIYEHPGEFEITFIKAPEIVFDRYDIRLTTDTEEDFYLQQSVYKALVSEGRTSIKEIVEYLDKNKPILEEMAHQIYLNSKL